MIIDAHHHFWQYSPAEYGWIDDSLRALRRDFLPADLEKAIRAAGVDGVVSVHARQSLVETHWLLDFAARHAFIKGVVGWLPLKEPDVRKLLERHAANKRLKGLRHVIQGEPDEAYLLNDDFNRGVDLLPEFGLTFDILIYERQLPAAIRFVDRHPKQVFVLDHLAKPRIRERILAPWRENLRELARRENVYGKLSGLVTEADFMRWTPQELQPYMQAALEAFGPRRLMFGSDWPVVTVASDYGRWLKFVRAFTARLTPDEQAAILGGNATRVYQLS